MHLVICIMHHAICIMNYELKENFIWKFSIFQKLYGACIQNISEYKFLDPYHTYITKLEQEGRIAKRLNVYRGSGVSKMGSKRIK